MVLRKNRGIDAAQVGNMSNNVADFSVASATTDGATDQKETIWRNTEFETNLGYYYTIPELKSTIDTKAKWVVGKGFKADKKTKEIMSKWRGWGKDTPNQILQNCVRTYYVGGDSFCEIIRDDSIFKKIFTWFGFVNPGKPLNLKPLDPSVMGVVVNKKGMLIRYEQYSKTDATAKPKIFKPHEIFHLAKNRFADEIHGTSIIKAIKNIILMRNEAMADLRTVFHRYVKPLWVWRLETDDPDKIADFMAKADSTVGSSENIYIPNNTAEAERMSIPQFSTLDPLPWIKDLTEYFYQATNTPDVIVGSAEHTVEASAKILYLAFQQSVEDDQLFVEENIESQLGLKINLEFPASIQTDLISGNEKDGPVNIDKKETTANLEGKK